VDGWSASGSGADGQWPKDGVSFPLEGVRRPDAGKGKLTPLYAILGNRQTMRIENSACVEKKGDLVSGFIPIAQFPEGLSA
jgi:hypothetical protein